MLSRSASPSAPVLRVLRPNGGETIGAGSVTLQWEGKDADGDALTYLVQYSPDDGNTWETLVLDWVPNLYTLDAALLRGTTAGRIRVIASDGFNTTVAESDRTFTVLNHPPDAAIRRPAPGTLFSGGQAVVLEATAQDLEDGSLADERLRWTSDVDGLLGIGPYLQRSATAFTQGPHSIQLIARDADGFTSTGTVQIVILRNVPSDLADLDLDLSEAEGPLPDIKFRARIENRGPTEANAVQMTTELPLDAKLVSATSSVGACQNDAHTLRCSLGTLGAGEAVNIEVRLRCSTSPSGSLRVQVTTSGTDPVPANNVADLVLAALPVQPEPVRLAVRFVGGEVVLSWPASAADYVIESTDSLV